MNYYFIQILKNWYKPTGKLQFQQKLAKYINRKLSEKRNPKGCYAYEKVSNTEQDKSEMVFHAYHTDKS